MSKFEKIVFVDVRSNLTGLSFDGVSLNYGDEKSVAKTELVRGLIAKQFLSELVSSEAFVDQDDTLLLKDEVDNGLL
jgi:hypothetical protein